MRIDIDLKKTSRISEIVHKPNIEVRNEYHLSDGVYCELLAYCRLTGLQSKPTRRTAAFWNIGRAMHTVMEENFEITEKEFTFAGAVCHIDVLFNSEPIEFKTTRKTIRTKEDLSDVWLKQVILECIFANSRVGWLCVLEIIPALITVWKVDLDYSDLFESGKAYLDFLSRCKLAVKTKNPYLLIPLAWFSKGCTYIEDCPRAVDCRTLMKRIIRTKGQEDRRKKKLERSRADR